MTVAAGALAKPHVIRAGHLFLTDDGGISPKKLPRNRRVPISAFIRASIGTTDGSHPPAVKTLNIDFDRSFQVNARGLPACHKNQLENRTTRAAKQACRRSIIGSGQGAVEVAFPDQTPFTAKGPVVLFNGGVRGRTTLLLVHTYVAVPAPTAVIVPVTISPIRKGRYGLRTVAQVPTITGGFGSITQFNITINRKFSYKGKKRSYLTGRCPTGRYYVRGNILFADGSRLKGTHVLSCIPKG
jgi:hypothetical protein